MNALAILAASARRRVGSFMLLAATTAAIAATLGTFAAAASSPSFAGLAGYKVYVRRAFIGSAGAMGLFAILSGWFLSEHYLAGRRREIALWLLAGMRKRRAWALVSLELAASISSGLAAGLALGAALSRLFALLLGALMKAGEVPELGFGGASFAVAAGACCLQLLLASGRAALEASRSSIAWLARAERDPEEPSRGSAPRAAIGVSLLAGGYAAAFLSSGALAEALLLPALAAAACGTFLAFDALLPALASALRAAPGAGLGAASTFAAAQVAFRSRRNARLLALSAILIGMSASAAGTVLAVAARIEEEAARGQGEMFGAMLFIGGFLSAAFALSAAVLLAARAASDAREDLARHIALRDLGATRRTMLEAIAMQSAFFFGLPLAFGLAHGAAAMAMLRGLSGYPTALPALAAGLAVSALMALIATVASSSQLNRALGESGLA